ncbi:muropeptide transporter [Gammaproteobacteria bacterium]|nr:muropeptide transporter [Gammaproteobacteria bacterium]
MTLNKIALSAFFLIFRPYFTRSIIVIFVLGFAAGLPILMTLSTLTYWLSKFEVTKANIGLLALTGLPYTFKFLWAPFLDHFNIPLLSRLGRRRGWLILLQSIIIAVFLSLSLLNPKDHIYLIAILIFTLSLASSSQDVIIDAYRIDSLEADQQAFGVSSYLMGYRLAMLIVGVGVLALSDFIDWAYIFIFLAGLMLFSLLFCLMLANQESNNKHDKEIKNANKESLNIQAHFKQMILDPFKDFLKRNQALLLIAFILVFKLPDVISGVMATPFYTEMQFTGTQIGAVTKIYGVLATITGAVLGATLVKMIGLYRALWFSAISLGLTNLSYLLIFYSPTITSLAIAITVENLVSGLASTAFITFLSLLCNKQYSATQYALLSALTSAPLRFLAPAAGFLADILTWDNFFIFTSVLFIPALCLVIILKKNIQALKIY